MTFLGFRVTQGAANKACFSLQSVATDRLLDLVFLFRKGELHLQKLFDLLYVMIVLGAAAAAGGVSAVFHRHRMRRTVPATI
mmetsp:Transcript_49485/g.120136  ORF Transcript_49485/g.120136 Transcript_49485/m.120136 type:complete len:82 (-) Transcript_49485:357-602(-)